MKSTKKNSFESTQEHEAESWLIPNDKERRDKSLREQIRYPLLKRQMGLNHLDTSDMVVYDIGAGPLGGVSSVVNCREVMRFDPLADEYEKYFPLYNYFSDKAEDLDEELGSADLIIITNALDHFDNPVDFLQDLKDYMKEGAFFAHIHAINNAYSHPHEAHAHNVNPELMHEMLSNDFELVWNMDFQNDGLTYGWRKQPAFSQLWRKSKYGRKDR